MRRIDVQSECGSQNPEDGLGSDSAGEDDIAAGSRGQSAESIPC